MSGHAGCDNSTAIRRRPALTSPACPHRGMRVALIRYADVGVRALVCRRLNLGKQRAELSCTPQEEPDGDAARNHRHHHGAAATGRPGDEPNDSAHYQ